MDEFNNQTNETPVYEEPVYTSTNTSDGQNPQDKKAKGLAIASLVCSICGILVGCCCIYLGIPLGIAGVVTGCMSKRADGSKPGLAIAGIILGALAIVGLAAMLIFNIVTLATGGMDSMFNSYY